MWEINYTTLLSSVVLNGLLTSTLGVWLKGRIDRNLEKQKAQFELVKSNINTENQRSMELLRQMNDLKRNNLEYYQSTSQISHQKIIDSLDKMWKLYTTERVKVSPIVDFYSVLVPSEYMNVYKSKDFGLEALSDVKVPNNYDTFPTLIELEQIRPFIGEEIYYKMRSALCIINRVIIMFTSKFEKGIAYEWIEDELLKSHIDICLSNNSPDYDFIKTASNPKLLQYVFGSVEREITRSINEILSGEKSSELSLHKTSELLIGTFSK